MMRRPRQPPRPMRRQPTNAVYAISQTPQVWLDHQVSEHGGRLSVCWDVVDGLFPAGMIEAMFSHYARLLDALTEAPSLDWRPSMPDDVPDSVASAAPSAVAPDPDAAHVLLHSAFERAAIARPAHAAVIAVDRTLDYGTLRTEALALAHLLHRRAEVRPNTLVAVAMRKGWEQVVAVLAVTYAGGGLPAARPGTCPPSASCTCSPTRAWGSCSRSPGSRCQRPWPDGIERIGRDTRERHARGRGHRAPAHLDAGRRPGPTSSTPRVPPACPRA